MKNLLKLIAGLVGLSLVLCEAARTQTVPTPPIVAMGCAYNVSIPTPTDKNFFLVQCDNTGKLLTSVGGGGSGGTSSNFGAAFPATGTAAGAEYLSSPPTLTTGQMVAFQTDVNGNLKTIANAGTNLNTSLLALEAGGNLAALNATLGATTDGVWSGTGNSTQTQTERAIYNAVIAPPTPCSTSNCGGANPIGSVIAIAGTNLNTSALALDTSVNGILTTQGSTTAGQKGTAPLQIEVMSQSPATLTTGTTQPWLGDLFANARVALATTGITVTPTLASTAQYAAGQCVGGLFTFTSAGAQGELKSITVTSKAVVSGVTFKVYIFNNLPTTICADHAAPSITSADSNKQLKVITLSNPDSGLGTATEWDAANIGVSLQNTAFYAYVITMQAFTPGSTTDISVRATVNL